MAIKVQHGDRVAALDYDKVHMEFLRIDQPLSTIDGKPPTYIMRIRYRLYAVDPLGKRHYKPGANFLEYDDLYPVAKEKAAQGDTDLLVAMGAIEKALASIIADATEYGETEII